MMPLGFKGGIHDTMIASDDIGSTLIPAGGPGTKKRHLKLPRSLSSGIRNKFGLLLKL